MLRSESWGEPTMRGPARSCIMHFEHCSLSSVPLPGDVSLQLLPSCNCYRLQLQRVHITYSLCGGYVWVSLNRPCNVHIQPRILPAESSCKKLLMCNWLRASFQLQLLLLLVRLPYYHHSYRHTIVIPLMLPLHRVSGGARGTRLFRLRSDAHVFMR